MKRRHFLQLAGAAAAGVMAGNATAAPALQHDPSLAVSGWLDEDGVIHVMLENPQHTSTRKVELSNLQTGRCYRMRVMNATNRDTVVRLPGRRMELSRVEQAPVAGTVTNMIQLTRFGVVEANLFL